MRARRAACWLWLLVAALAAGACSDDGSPEAQVRVLIDTAVEAAESRSVDGLGKLLHANFRDHKGNDPATLRRLLTAWFFRHRNIHLLTRIETIELLSPSRAEVGLYVAMAGSAIGDAAALASLRARVYRFDLTLVRDDEWRVLEAAYSPASLTDLR